MRALVFLAALLVVPLAPARAEALTVRDLIELSRAGLGDDVLLALIEVDGSVFSIDAATLRSLKDAGVSERVILAVVRSGRTRPEASEARQEAAPVPQPAPDPQVVVIEHRDAPHVRVVAVPIYIPVVPRVAPRPAEPVYWGWGGKLRPDAWQPSPPPQPTRGDAVIRIDPPIKPDPPIIK